MSPLFKKSKASSKNSVSKKIEVDKKPKKEAENNWPESEGQLAIDVYQTETEIVIQSTIAGVKASELDISIENDMVTIRGKRERPEKDNKNYFYQECYWGPFSRQIILPEEVDSSRAKAIMKEGVLTVTIPKISRLKKRKVSVKG